MSATRRDNENSMRPIGCVPAIAGTPATIPLMLTPKVSQVSATTAHPIKPKRT